jgi:hypothetical protein
MLTLFHAVLRAPAPLWWGCFRSTGAHGFDLDVARCCAVEDSVQIAPCHADFRWGSPPRAALFEGESCRGHGWRLGLDGRNRPAPQISPTCGLPRETNFWGFPVLHCVTAAGGAARPSLALWITDKARWA